MNGGEWDDLAMWWQGEIVDDATYRQAVLPLIERLSGSGLVLDLGCGEGQVMRALEDCAMVGCDINPSLLEIASKAGPVVRIRLPDLGCFVDDAFDGAVMVLVLEHLAEVASLFASVLRVVRPGGSLALVVNHPLVTAPGAASVVDPTDGEVFWRPGHYLDVGATSEAAGDRTVTFHHRPVGLLLTEAAAAGWVLDEVVETNAEAHGAAPSRPGVPTLLGVRWHRPVSPAAR